MKTRKEFAKELFSYECASFTNAGTMVQMSSCISVGERTFWNRPYAAKYWRRHLRRQELAQKHKQSGKRPRNKGPWTNKNG